MKKKERNRLKHLLWHQILHIQPCMYNHVVSMCINKHTTCNLLSNRTFSVSILDNISLFIWTTMSSFNMSSHVYKQVSTRHKQNHFAPWAMVLLWKRMMLSLSKCWLTLHCCSQIILDLKQRERNSEAQQHFYYNISHSQDNYIPFYFSFLVKLTCWD